MNHTVGHDFMGRIKPLSDKRRGEERRKKSRDAQMRIYKTGEI